ncbi:MAG: DamX protein [Paraglaciecola sp.]|jgi:DamX protein
MSTSELHSRLEHLVSYSSQLIFVSNDKISQQSKIVEAFLGHQAENTEIAIIDAKQTTFLRDYRNQLFKQLIGGTTTADFDRPLNQLLSVLNTYEGPILIIVSHAENLPQKFLQELWELVLQSRFAANKQHLNVLLFTKSEWAEQAKTWLPTKGGNKPILLNSESILNLDGDTAKQTGQTDLEKLINTKREQFAARIKGREDSYEAIQPVLRKPWLAGSVILLFVGVFGGMLYWQYPDVANGWWKHLEGKFAALPEASTTEQGVLSPEDTNDSPQLAGIAAKQKIQHNTSLVGSDVKQTLIEEFSPVVSDRLITNWKTVVKQIDNAATSRLTQSGTDQLYKAPYTLNASPAKEISVNQANITVEQAVKSQSDGIVNSAETTLKNDYKVEDITSIDQLQTGSVKVRPSLLTNAILAENSNVGASEQNDSLRFSYDEATLLTLPANRYLLQVAAMADPLTMQTYIQENQLRNQLWVYKTQRYGADWFVLLHNQSYLTLILAKNAVSSLSEALQQGPPFVKTSKQVIQEINR